MAGTGRQTTSDLTNLMAALEEKPHGFDFFSAMRRIECRYPERPRLGTAKRPADEPVRVSQEPDLTFEAASLTGFRPGSNGDPHRLSVRLLGLLGPNGPLPLHFTEYVKRRIRDHGDPTWAHFLDIFHHRMLSLFYRAWANNEPAVSYDRPAADRFGGYVGSLAGLGMASLHKRDAIADETKLFYCGRLSAQSRCAEGLQAILTDYFHVPAAIEEFVGEWIALPEEQICRLGLDRANGRLGRTAMAGTTVWSCQHKFRIRLGPLNLAQYERFLPSGESIGRLVPLVRNYIGDELAWDLRLVLKKEEVPPARLDGAARLGWNSWMGERSRTTDAQDLVVDAFEWVVHWKEDRGGR
jgi:type VI secretion system protein ImpH